MSGLRTTAAVVLSFAGGLLLLNGILQQGPVGELRRLDIAAGAVASVALVLRRRAPVVVGLALAAAAAVFAAAGVANMVALFAVARRRRLRVALAVGLVDVGCGCLFWLLYPGNSTFVLTLTVNVAIAAAVTAWGALLQSQAALIDSYRERAERIEQEQQLRENEVRQAERTRIAREMHDAVAHRVSLVALHAGGLAVATDPSQATVREAAGLIRTAATQALDELREALGVLRADEPRSLEQPGLDRIDDLVRDARTAGQQVQVEIDADLGAAVPPSTGRAAYRVVQEGLTNARKHATGAVATVTLEHVDGVLRVAVSNAVTTSASLLPGSGRGLVGLRERATLAGGTLRHGPAPDGRFDLRAELPWP